MSTVLSDLFKKMSVDNELTDCTIIVDSVRFECHKFVLSIDSEFFRRMFLSNFKESSSQEIKLDGVTPVIFKIYREYIYSYDSSIIYCFDTQTIIKLFECGKMWMTPSIVKCCIDVLSARSLDWTLQDIVPIFELAQKHNDEFLINRITEIITSKTKHTSIFSKINATFLLSFENFQKFINICCKVTEKEALIEKYLKFNEHLYKPEATKDDINPKEPIS